MGTAWTTNWTAEKTEHLRVLWFEGWSALECGKELGCSRNSVIGKIRRLGWHHYLRHRRPAASKALALRGPTLPPEEPLPEPPARLLKTTEQPVSKPKKKRLADPPKLKAEARKLDPPIGSFGLMDLRFGVCKWPEGDRPPFAYCGDKALEAMPYCEVHTRRARQGPQHRARPVESYAIKRLARSG